MLLASPAHGPRPWGPWSSQEETGVRTQFVGVAAMRESQTGPFQTTDCYYVCVMALDAEAYSDGAIPDPSPQEAEIAATR
jgi:hypothetical protein